MRGFSLVFLGVASLALPGCLAKTALDIATAPVKVVSKGVDLATTSQSEADEKRGREIRKREEELAKLERAYDKQIAKCSAGDEKSCNEARTIYAQIQQIIPTIPVEPDTND